MSRGHCCVQGGVQLEAFLKWFINRLDMPEEFSE